MQSYFKGSKDVRLNSTHSFIMKIPNRRELQQIALNHSSDILLKDFDEDLQKMYFRTIFFFGKWSTTLPSDNPLRFSKNLLK